MKLNKKVVIVFIVLCSLFVGFGFGYTEGLQDGFHQGRDSFVESPPEGCYCKIEDKPTGNFVIDDSLFCWNSKKRKKMRY